MRFRINGGAWTSTTGEPERPGRRRLSVPRRGHRSGRQQLDQQRHRGDRRQHRADRRHAVLRQPRPTAAAPTRTPITQDGTFDLSLSGNTDANGTSVAYEVSTQRRRLVTSTTASQSGLADGDYQFRAVVTDPAGNSSTSNAIEVIVDNTAPTAGTLAFANLDRHRQQPTRRRSPQDGTFDLSLSGNTRRQRHQRRL